jgi:hypothetical protein
VHVQTDPGCYPQLRIIGFISSRARRRAEPDAIAWLLDKHTNTAASRCPSLNKKRVTPHVLRHYVDGMVMWPAGVFPLLTASGPPIPAT